MALAEERLKVIQSVKSVVVDGVVTFDSEQIIRSANQVAVSMFGYEKNELIGKALKVLFDHESPIAQTADELIEIDGKHKDGTLIPIGISMSETTEDEQQVIVASIRDLREIREKEQQISLLESLLSLKSLDFINQGISVFDRDLKLLSANQTFLDLLEFPDSFSIPGTPFDEMLRFNARRGEYGDGDIETQVSERLALVRKFEPHEFERIRKDGTVIHVFGTPIDEGIGGFITVYTDVTKERMNREQKDQEIKELESVLHLEAMDHIGVGVAVYDDELKLIHANRVHAELYGFPEELTRQGTPAVLLARFLAESGAYGDGIIEEQVQKVIDVLSLREGKKRDLSLRDGRIIEIRSNPLRRGVVLVHSDVTKERKAVEKIKSTDPVTGLPTLESLMRNVAKVFPGISESGNQAMGLRMQVDRFGMINEVFGQDIGDQLLRQIAQRIRGIVSNHALLGRAGGNEFVLVDEGDDGASIANIVVKALKGVMKPPFYFRSSEGKRQKVSFTLSGGIVLFPQNGTDLVDLTHKSRLAMQYAATQGGDTFRFFDWKSTRRQFSSDRISLENDLRVAVEEKQFVLNYQPQIELHRGRLHGCEALIRWNHPQQGIISPLDFIPVAEETGLIVPIGSWVLYEACVRAKRWQEIGHPPMVMSVNVSVVQFRQEGFVDEVRSVLEATGLKAEYLELEVTESIVADDLDVTRNILGQLKELGIKLAIDDFGTGYSSLAYLTKLPFDTLKIDQAFVRGTEKHNWAIVRAVTQLARSLGLTIVAEGVETSEQADVLSGIGCQLAQGYFYSRPLPEDEFGVYLSNHDTLERGHDQSSRQRPILRVGLPTFAAINQLQRAALQFQKEHPDMQLEIQCDVSDRLIEALALGELDVVLAVTSGPIDIDPVQIWYDSPVWIAGSDVSLDKDGSVPLLAHPEGSPFRKRMIDALKLVDRQWQIVYQSPALRGIINALASNIGVTALPLESLAEEKLFQEGQICLLNAKEHGLPALDTVECGIYSRELEEKPRCEWQALFEAHMAEVMDSFGYEKL